MLYTLNNIVVWTRSRPLYLH